MMLTLHSILPTKVDILHKVITCFFGTEISNKESISALLVIEKMQLVYAYDFASVRAL